METNKRLLTKEEAQEKWNNLPKEEKAELIMDFGIYAEPMWLFWATRCQMTEAGEKL